MIGQSNMAGRGFVNEVPMICNERIQMLRNGRWQTMTEPINYDRPVSGISLAGSFSAMWCMKNENDNLGLIPCAEGGSVIDDWSVDKVLFQHAISEAKFALRDSELIGILWHHGESDSYGGSYKTYYEKLKVIIDTLREELNAENIPLIIGGLGDYLGKSAFGSMCTEYNLINDELIKFAENENNCYFVTAKGLDCNPDGIHINAVSQRKFGVRYYYAIAKKESEFSPLENEEELLDKCINNKELTQNEKSYLNMMDFALGKIDYEEFMKRFSM